MKSVDERKSKLASDMDALSDTLKEFVDTEKDEEGKTKWGSPVLEGMFSEPSMWRIGKSEAKVFLMSEDPDLKDYAEIISKSSATRKDPEIIIHELERQYDESEHTWKIFVVWAPIEYKQLSMKSKKEQPV
jgi:hypothetical protein